MGLEGMASVVPEMRCSESLASAWGGGGGPPKKKKMSMAKESARGRKSGRLSISRRADLSLVKRALI